MVRQRYGQKVSTETTLLHSAMAAVLTGKVYDLNRRLKELRNG